MNPAYDDTVCSVIEKLVESNGGSTSFFSAPCVFSGKPPGRSARREALYRSGPGELPRSELLRLFREDRTSVLIGSASFREGWIFRRRPDPGHNRQDPLPHPGDPLVQARNALEGRAAFSRTILPEAKMLLKQAAGRLIRSREDRGRVAIIDGRVLQRRDWNIPAAALPRVKYRRLVVSSNLRRNLLLPPDWCDIVSRLKKKPLKSGLCFCVPLGGVIVKQTFQPHNRPRKRKMGFLARSSSRQAGGFFATAGEGPRTAGRVIVEIPFSPVFAPSTRVGV